MRKLLLIAAVAAVLAVPVGASMAAPSAKPTTTTSPTTTTTAPPTGIPGYEVVTNHVDINPGDDVGTGSGDRMAGVGALCPIGKRPLGGGGGSVGPGGYAGRTDVILQASHPLSAGNQEGWKVITRRISDNTTDGYTINVWVICATAA